VETRVTLDFADGRYDFWLPMPRVIAAEREADTGIFALFHELGENLGRSVGGEMVLVGATPARLKACHAVIRNALCGGGTAEQEARELVETYCYPARPAMFDLALAWNILKAAVYGIDMTAVGSKKKAEEAPTSGS
jgi:hypothetical protein